jgi:two-component system, OmpR family, sensor histidine kinase BaeS
VNLVAFQRSADRKVSIYQTETQVVVSIPDPDKLQAFTKLGELDADTQGEYKSALEELSTISTALQNISDHPELYIGSSGSSTSTSLSINTSSGKGTKLPFFAIFDIRTFGQDTPEGRLVTGIIRDLIIMNMFWLMIVYILYMLWVRSIFAPVERVTENIRKITENGEYTTLTYNKKDEFFPLISSINSLHKSLSIQEKIRSNFLSDLSHEIRTPITAVKCYLEAIEDGVMKLDTKTLHLFQNELDRLAQTTEEIMQFDRATHPMQKDIRVARISMRKTLTPLIQEYLPQCQKTWQAIDIDMPRDTMTRIDESMFTQIVHNIFSNFIKYAGSGSTLTCGYAKTDTTVILSFIDDGVGIPQQDLPYVKEKFYRVDTGRTRTDKSMGIGLSIIDHIMRVHGGSFTLENTEPHGLSITLTFPR